MRYLGNKRKLLSEIERCARRLGFKRGRVCDLFAGTGVVARHFRELGNEVLSADLMLSSFLFQKLFLECEEFPKFAELIRALRLPARALSADRIAEGTTLRGDRGPLLRVLAHLEQDLAPLEGPATRQFSTAGAANRMYFSPENARRMDAILLALRDWRSAGLLREIEYCLLLAVTLDAADTVANISGTYGAFLKKWQPNALRPLELFVPRLVAGPKGVAHNVDALAWISGVEADLLYIDPPYNSRQYPANYHVLEALARVPSEPDLAALEQSLYGKTGMLPWEHRASPLCSQRGSRCRDEFARMLGSTSVPKVVISYNEEGIITKAEFHDMLAEFAGVARAKLTDYVEVISYPRFRSDADGRVATNGARRQYRQIDGRARDEVHEWLLFARKKALRKAATR